MLVSKKELGTSPFLSPSAGHCQVAACNWWQESGDRNLSLDGKAEKTHLIRQVDVEGRGQQAV
jgi:hypothetical protein